MTRYLEEVAGCCRGWGFCIALMGGESIERGQVITFRAYSVSVSDLSNWANSWWAEELLHFFTGLRGQYKNLLSQKTTDPCLYNGSHNLFRPPKRCCLLCVHLSAPASIDWSVCGFICSLGEYFRTPTLVSEPYPRNIGVNTIPPLHTRKMSHFSGKIGWPICG